MGVLWIGVGIGEGNYGIDERHRWNIAFPPSGALIPLLWILWRWDWSRLSREADTA